jgi:hypothetical protein
MELAATFVMTLLLIGRVPPEVEVIDIPIAEIVIAVLLAFVLFWLLARIVEGPPSAQDAETRQTAQTKAGNNAQHRGGREGVRSNMKQGMDDKYQEFLSKARAKYPKIQELEKLFKDLTPDQRKRLEIVAGPEFQRIVAQVLAEEGEAIATQRALLLRETLELEKRDMQIDLIAASLETDLRGVAQLQALHRKFAAVLDDPNFQTIGKTIVAQRISQLMRTSQEQAGVLDAAVAQLFLAPPPDEEKVDTTNTVDAEFVPEDSAPGSNHFGVGTDPLAFMKDVARRNGNGTKPPRG